MHKAVPLYSLLTNRAFRKCQPSEDDVGPILNILADCMDGQKPIPLLARWAKTVSDGIGKAEQAGIDFMADNLGKISAIHLPGIRVAVLFEDVHTKFNGTELSPLHAHTLEQKFKSSFARKKNLAVNVELASAHLNFTPTPDGRGFKEFERLEALAAHSSITHALMTRLTKNAAKYYTKSSPDMQTVAKMYYELCKLAKEPIGKTFPGHILLTYNGPNNRELSFPQDMPALHVCSLWKGISEKPWNVDDKKFTELKRRFHKDGQGASSPGRVL